MKIVIDPIKYGVYLHNKVVERKRQEMEARAELLLKNAFRRNNMNGKAGLAKGTDQPKAFGLIVKDLTSASILAKQLSTKSFSLVSLYISKLPLQKEEKDTNEAVQPLVLTQALQEITNNLNQSLLEISNNLEELEKAW